MMIIRQGWVHRDQADGDTVLFRGEDAGILSPIPDQYQEKATLFIGNGSLHVPIDTVLQERMALGRALRDIRKELVAEENRGDEEALREGLRLVLDEAERAGVGEGKGSRVPDIRLVPAWTLRDALKCASEGRPLPEYVLKKMTECLQGR